MLIRVVSVSGLMLLTGILVGRTLDAADTETWDGTIVQYGTMHEAIGEQQHQGRVQLNTLVERPHFFAVGALDKLEGEITILDNNVTVTRVDAARQLESGKGSALENQATLLIGAYVPSWAEHKVAENVEPDKCDQYLADVASKTGINTSKPFMFTVEGDFSKVKLHVINGACPMHARLKKIELPKERQPFEADLEKIHGTIVGVFAKDAVGKITHPSTSIHMHLLYKDAKSGRTVTAHVEQLGLLDGAVLRLPRSK